MAPPIQGLGRLYLFPRQAKQQEDPRRVHEIAVIVAGQAARVFVGGHGEPLLLIHGGWGGARLHWEPVWERLAEHFQVIAPDLPGIGRTDQASLRSVGEYARWLERIVNALGAPSVWCVGNSFGASVACRFATDFPERCRGLVLVNGIPMPATPPIMRWLGERPFGHRLVRVLEKKVAYSPSSLERAFADPARAPRELRALLSQPSPPQLEAFVSILVHGGSPAACRIAPLLLWGERDRLLGTNARDARKLQAGWRGSKLAFVPDAGHMPQLENPTAFVDEIVTFVAGSAGAVDASTRKVRR